MLLRNEEGVEVPEASVDESRRELVSRGRKEGGVSGILTCQWASQ